MKCLRQWHNHTYSDTVLRKMIGRIADKYHTIMVDETTDVSNMEQLVFCLRYVDDELISHESLENTSPKSILGVIKRIDLAEVVSPATNALSERSFSALRHLKTWLRSTMHQTRLN